MRNFHGCHGCHNSGMLLKLRTYYGQECQLSGRLPFNKAVFQMHAKCLRHSDQAGFGTGCQLPAHTKSWRLDLWAFRMHTYHGFYRAASGVHSCIPEAFLCWSLNASREVEYARVDSALKDTRDLAGWQQLSGCAEALWHLLAKCSKLRCPVQVLVAQHSEGQEAPWLFKSWWCSVSACWMQRLLRGWLQGVENSAQRCANNSIP